MKHITGHTLMSLGCDYILQKDYFLCNRTEMKVLLQIPLIHIISLFKCVCSVTNALKSGEECHLLLPTAVYGITHVKHKKHSVNTPTSEIQKQKVHRLKSFQ
jgi:hypothetical protein